MCIFPVTFKKMKFRNTFLSLLFFFKLGGASAHSIDCAHFYANASDFEKDLIELKNSFYPLPATKQEHLEKLQYSVRNFSRETDKILLSSVKLLREKGVSIRDIAKTCSIGVGTTYKILNAES